MRATHTYIRNLGGELGKSAPYCEVLKEKSVLRGVNWRRGSVPWTWWVSIL